MIDEIYEMRKTLEKLLTMYDLRDKKVLKASHELDQLILEYYENEIKLKNMDFDIDSNDSNYMLSQI